ncbi:MAG: anhydro-N-acetylmuramic acid kinase, partial [Bacteroidia bacterium]|nr:anhydro-N-acetylmuramic acid kinase [Bacteroidia bacterium]
MSRKYRAIGVMSGTSLDGLDLAQCLFQKSNDQWHYSIEKAHTYPYSGQIKEKLDNAASLSAREFIIFHKEFGHFIGNMINDFLIENSVKIDYIASHGHTIFHEPSFRLTFQFGEGSSIA